MREPYRIELIFLSTLLLLKAVLFARFLGTELGYDVAAHLEVLSTISWQHPFLPTDASLYSWHPPLGFLAAKSVMASGLPPLLSTQIVCFVASLVGFLVMRQVVKALGLLSDIRGILFLYIGASIPMQAYLGVLVSLDVLVLAMTSIAVLCCVQLFWKETSQLRRILYGATFVLTIGVAVFSKMSGILLITLPILAAFLSPKRSRAIFLSAIILMVLGVGIVGGYFLLRPMESVLFFNTDATSEWAEPYRLAMTWRDSHPFAFLLGFIAPVGRPPQLIATWQSFWSLVNLPVLTIPGFVIGMLYTIFLPLACVAGCIRLVRNRANGDVWTRFGLLLLCFGCIQLAALLYYMYTVPIGGYFSNKGIYIASVSWILAFVLTEFLGRIRTRLLLSGAFLFMLLNYLLPVA